jgi:hypothetical protein
MIGASVCHIFYLLMQEFGDVLQLPVRHGRECGHAFIGTALPEEWRKVLSMIVTEDHVRCDQARPCRAASCVTVTEAAVLPEQRGSA